MIHIRHITGLFLPVFTVLLSKLFRTCTGQIPPYMFDECGNCTIIVHKTQGTVVDCNSKDFFHVPNCKVENIKQLLLSSNRITTVPENAFQAMNMLEVISLDDNRIRLIHEGAFHSVYDLKELYLEGNGLNQRSFSENVFNDLKKLQVLDICGNQFQYDKELDVENVISTLTNLQSLHIPGFEGLTFGHKFNSLGRLIELNICDNNIIYSNKIFQGFQNNTIEYLTIGAEILHRDTFTNFKHLKGLKVSGQDNILSVLSSLWPFVNKTLEYLRISNNVGMNLAPVITITSDHFKYLGEICTTKLDLSYNNILHIKHSATIALKKRSCIKTFNLAGNLLHTPTLFEIPFFRNLEYLNICCMVQMHQKRKNRSVDKTNIGSGKEIKHRISRTVKLEEKNRIYPFSQSRCCNKTYNLKSNVINLLKAQMINKIQINRTSKHIAVAHKRQYSDGTIQRRQAYSYRDFPSGELEYYFSPRLKFLNMSHTIEYEMQNISVKDGESVANIDISFSKIKCNFFVKGFSNLQVFNISFINCEYLISSFLKYYPKLKVFVAKNVNLNRGLKNVQEGSLFKGLTEIQHIDLAYNNLQYLCLSMFTDQTGSLKSLILSGNFLFSIPENLLNLTSLTFLDLSYNNYTLFSNSDIHVITTLISRGTRIRLEGNKFICTCDTGNFIRWLFTIKTMIDFKRIHCVMNNGTWRFLTDMDDGRYDLDLGCSSKFWLIFSISGISVLTVVLLLSVIAYRYRLDIEFFIFRCYWRLHPRQPFADYHHDVFIAASNEDVPWVCRELIKFLDEHVKVKTFYYHKDALPAQSIGDMICENIAKSRKIIFVITDAFLKSPWLGFELDQARMYMYKMYSEKNILIIFKGDISIKKCPDIIKTLHSKILFLQYPIDESEEELNNFWRKLEKCFENHDTTQCLDDTLPRVREATLSLSHARNQVV